MDQTKIRNNEKKILGEICKHSEKYNLLDPNLQKKLIDSIEISILNSAIDKSNQRGISVYWDNELFVEQYSNIGYKVKINLDINSSVNINKPEHVKNYLINNLCDFMQFKLLKTLKIKNFSYLLDKLSFNDLDLIAKYFIIDPENVGYLNSLQLNPYINQAYIDELDFRSKQNIKIKFSTMYKCSRCSNSKVSLQEKQTRSLDEPSCLFIHCLVCSHTWRQF